MLSLSTIHPSTGAAQTEPVLCALTCSRAKVRHGV